LNIFALKVGDNLYAGHKFFCRLVSYALCNAKLLSHAMPLRPALVRDYQSTALATTSFFHVSLQ